MVEGFLKEYLTVYVAIGTELPNLFGGNRVAQFDYLLVKHRAFKDYFGNKKLNILEAQVHIVIFSS